MSPTLVGLPEEMGERTWSGHPLECPWDDLGPSPEVSRLVHDSWSHPTPGHVHQTQFQPKTRYQLVFGTFRLALTVVGSTPPHKSQWERRLIVRPR